MTLPRQLSGHASAPPERGPRLRVFRTGISAAGNFAARISAAGVSAAGISASLRASPVRLGCRLARLLAAGLLSALATGLALTGCAHIHSAPQKEMVYVVAKQTFLRDRVAAVSNRVATVGNGDALQVLEHGRRFLKVKTPRNEIGWVEERLVIDEPTHQAFVDLKKEHGEDPVVGTAVLRDDLYMHLKPGRDTERFYLLPENAKLQLLVRASVPKPGPGQSFMPAPRKIPRAAPPPGRNAPPTSPSKLDALISTAPKPPGPPPPEAEAPPPPTPPKNASGAKGAPAAQEVNPLEDWWLVRDSAGQVGWLLARRLDVDVPEAIAGYAEGQKMVGAYVLAKVTDEQSSLPDKQVPEYVAVLNSYKDGLPYDFDQVRVFTWNTKKHRYETAYRQRNIEGYLPVEVTEIQGQTAAGKVEPLPAFSFKVATTGDVTTDPQTGAVHPTQTATQRYQMEGVMVKRLADPSQPASISPTPVTTRPHPRRHHR